MTVPVLILAFNRIDPLKRLVNDLRVIAPVEIYLACDGPRHAQEKIKTDEVRDFLIQNIDWTSNIYCLFREENLGCGKAVSSAITWFFDNVEQGIILEDDCLVDPSFFPFAAELLEKYKNDTQVMHIGAKNIYPHIDTGQNSYFFTNVPHIWGWASWRRAWQYYSKENLKHIYMGDFLEKKTAASAYQKFWKYIFKEVYQGRIDTWDYQWLATLWQHDGISIVPVKNMVTNIGYGKDATHTVNLKDPNAHLVRHEMQFPLEHPDIIFANQTYFAHYSAARLPHLIRRCLSKLKKQVLKYVRS